VTVVSGLVSPQVRMPEHQEQSAGIPSTTTLSSSVTAPLARPERRHLDLVGPGPT
jgi:hypothetical protein